MFRLRKSSPLDVGVHEQLDSLEPRKRTYGYLGEGNAINLVTNLIFTPIQFGMRNLPLAAVDILIVWGTIIWMMIAVWQHYRWVAVAQVPNFVWVSLAAVLQLSITAMNWGKP